MVKVREPGPASDSITSVEGSTRIEAKKQRRREGREAGRRRAPILSESEFLARRESVDRVMVIRQRDDVTQIAVLEDNVLVEHYVALETQSSLIGNVYLGRVQNVLPEHGGGLHRHRQGSQRGPLRRRGQLGPDRRPQPAPPDRERAQVRPADPGPGQQGPGRVTRAPG